MIVLIVGITIVGLLILFFPRNTNNTSLPYFSNSTPTPINQVTPPQTSMFHDIIKYDQQQTNKMINTLQNRPTIPPSDSTVKENIINTVANDSGTVNSTDEYHIDYLKSPDIFQVEIDTTNIQQAKSDAINWFKAQGMSMDSICKLPVTFYLKFDIMQELEQQGTTVDFNPLPDGC